MVSLIRYALFREADVDGSGEVTFDEFQIVVRKKLNLAPAEMPKQAATFDLPITLGILAGSGQFSSNRFDDYAVVGELSLDGQLRPVRGILPMAIAARDKGFAEKDAQGRIVNRVDSLGMIGGCTDTNEVNYLLGKFRFGLGILPYENQARL
jgi:hypothetical protein